MKLKFVLLFLAVIHPALALSEEAMPPAVAQALKQAGVPAENAAFFVQEVGSAKPSLSINASRPMNPASTIKLVTSYAALELLGPAYTWKTEAYLHGSLRGDILDGDLILKGYGDPKLTLENFWLMLRQIRGRGLREISGDLVLDRTWFEGAEHDPARFDAEPMRAYNVGPDALLLNFKAVRFQFIPDVEKNTVTVIAEPKPAQLDVISILRLGEGQCGDWREKIKPDFQSERKTRAIFTGVFPASCGEKSWNVSLLSHPQYVYGVFRQLWEELGGKLEGGLREDNTPDSAKFFAASESQTLSEIVRDINKFSNNVMARQLFLTIGAKAQRPPATLERASRAVKEWLAQKKLDFPELVLENGSGLSRIERISAEHLGAILINAYHSPVMPELIASLPIVSVDGTMKERLNDRAVAGQAHIKTGSLEGVRTIAGYVLDKTGKMLAVVCFINHPRAGNTRPVQDALLQWVYARDYEETRQKKHE